VECTIETTDLAYLTERQSHRRTFTGRVFRSDPRAKSVKQARLPRRPRRVPRLAAIGAYAKQRFHERLLEHRRYITTYGDDPPEIRDWKWTGDRGQPGEATGLRGRAAGQPFGVPGAQ
jgi:hypothetical protein